MAKFLVVDDDGFSRGLLAETLRALGHQISAAPDAREALQLLANDPHDGVITDVRMPGWDGIELARRISLLPDPLPVVLTSADPDFDIYEEALRRGVRPAGFLQKPFDRHGVTRVVRILTDGEPTAPTGTPRPEQATVPLARDENPDWLVGVRGNVTQLSPARMWFVAWRRHASGGIVVRGRSTTTIGLKRGQIVNVIGLPGLLAQRLPGVTADNLSTAIGGAMALGVTLEDALQGVAADVAAWTLSVRTGDVKWDPDWTADANAIPLPGAPCQLLAHALAEAPEELLLKSWQAISSSRVTARTPTDVSAEGWGLDPQAFRAHRLATGQAVQALVYELSGGVGKKRVLALRSLELLLKLNLVTLQA